MLNEISQTHKKKSFVIPFLRCPPGESHTGSRRWVRGAGGGVGRSCWMGDSPSFGGDEEVLEIRQAWLPNRVHVLPSVELCTLLDRSKCPMRVIHILQQLEKRKKSVPGDAEL